MRNFKRIAAAAISATMLLSTMSLNAFAATMTSDEAAAAAASIVNVAAGDTISATLSASATTVAPGGTFNLVFDIADKGGKVLNIGHVLAEISYTSDKLSVNYAPANKEIRYEDAEEERHFFALKGDDFAVNTGTKKFIIGAPGSGYTVIPGSDFATIPVTVAADAEVGAQIEFTIDDIAVVSPDAVPANITCEGKGLKVLVNISNETAPEVTPTPEVTEAPEVTPTPEVTEAPEVTPTPEVTEAPEVTPTPEATEEPEVDSMKVSAVKIKEGKAVSFNVTRTVDSYAGTVNVTVKKADEPVATAAADFAEGSKKTTVKMDAIPGAVKGDKLTVTVVYTAADGTVIGDETIDVTVSKQSSGGTSATTPVQGSTSTPSTTATEAPEATEAPTTPEATEEPTVDAPTTEVVTDPTVAAGFADVKELTPWAAADIDALASAGIVNGVSATEFNPTANVTREQFVKMIVGALGLDIIDTAVTFNDVDAKAYYAPYVATAVQNGIVKGVSDEWFGVGENITREDMATIIYRALNLSGTNLPAFADAADIAGYAQPAVAELATLGVITGYEDGTFAPKANATRAEAAVVINRVLTIVSADAEEEVVEETTEATEEVVAE